MSMVSTSEQEADSVYQVHSSTGGKLDLNAALTSFSFYVDWFAGKYDHFHKKTESLKSLWSHQGQFPLQGTKF